jgi:DNA-binding winged helix-turn-helix (wHTH) protein/Tfp pilus assembly protein PilF
MRFRFGEFEVDVHSQHLRKSGVRVRLQGKPFQLLAILLQHAGETVTREHFHRASWSDVSFGEVDHNLNNAVNKLRHALRDSAANPRYIETIPRVGYRFICPVERTREPVEQRRAIEAQAQSAEAEDLRVATPDPIREGDWQFPFATNRLRIAGLLLALCGIVAASYSFARVVRSQAAPVGVTLEGPKADLDAREYYVKGRFFWNKRNRPDLLLAIRYFEEALARDSNYALAYSGLADSYSVLGMVSPNPRSLYQDARRMAIKSVLLDNKSAEGHASLGLVYVCDWQFQDATHEFQEAIALNPAYPSTHHWYGLHLRSMGRMREGLRELELAHRLDPLSLQISFALANAYRKDGYYVDAEKGYAEIVRFDSSFQRVKAGLALLNHTEPHSLSIFAAYPRSTTSIEEAPEVAEYVAAGLYRGGQAREAAELMTRMTKQVRSLDGQCFPVLLATMGKIEELLTCLQEGYKERAGYLPQIKTDPVFREVRSDPRFQQLMHRIGLPSDGMEN